MSKFFKKENLIKIYDSFKAVLIPLGISFVLYCIYISMKSDTYITGTVSQWNYIITQPFVIVQYFKTFLLPTELSADSDWPALTTILDKKFFLGLMFITGMLWLAFRLSKKKVLRPVSFGIFWFFIALFPTSVIRLSEVLNDHRVYFPYIGLSLAGSSYLIYLFILRDEKKFNKSILMKFTLGVIALGLICCHAYGTYQRNKVWHSDESLWYDVAQKSPENGRGLMNYGLSQMNKGNYSAAKYYFEKALKLTPNYSLLYINLGVLNGAMGNIAEAENYYKSAISINLYQDESYYYYGNFLSGQKRYEEAKNMFENSIKINPANTVPRFALMALYHQTNDWDKLKKTAEETLQYLPNDAKCIAYINTANSRKSK